MMGGPSGTAVDYSLSLKQIVSHIDVLEPDTPHSLNPRARLRPSIDDARDIAKRLVGRNR